MVTSHLVHTQGAAGAGYNHSSHTTLHAGDNGDILTDHFLDILWTLHLLAAKWIMDNPGLKVVPSAAPVPV